jgi:ubiquitin-protein ligase
MQQGGSSTPGGGASGAPAQLSQQFLKRRQSELKNAHKEQDKNPSFDGDILMSFDQANSQKILCGCIGSTGTPFEGAFLVFQMLLPPNFAFEPPKVEKLVWTSGRRLHPNIYANGKVCMDIINTFGSQQWVPTFSLMAVMRSVSSLLDSEPYSREPGFESSGSASERQMYSDKIQFYSIERGVVDLATWCLKRSLGLEHLATEYAEGYLHFSPLIKANAWLFRHRLEERISDLEKRRREGAAFQKVAFEHSDSDMGGLTGGCARAFLPWRKISRPRSRHRRFTFLRLRSSVAAMEQLFHDEMAMWRQVPSAAPHYEP